MGNQITLPLYADREPVHIVALSGGKDSTAMALRLAEVEPRPYLYVCTPTGDEFPEMFAHWRRLGELLGRPIIPATAHTTLDGMIEERGALPNWRMRWCTKDLKLRPYARWLSDHLPAISYVGLRADEPQRQGGVYDHVPGVTMDFPLRRWGWGLRDVLAYLAKRGVTIPRRTDCRRCFFQTLHEWYLLWVEDPAGYRSAEAQEAHTGHTFRSPGRDTQPAALRELREKFEAGYVPKPKRSPLADGQCRACSL